MSPRKLMYLKIYALLLFVFFTFNPFRLIHHSRLHPYALSFCCFIPTLSFVFSLMSSFSSLVARSGVVIGVTMVWKLQGSEVWSKSHRRRIEATLGFSVCIMSSHIGSMGKSQPSCQRLWWALPVDIDITWMLDHRVQACSNNMPVWSW